MKQHSVQGKKTLKEPLTQEEQEFASEHHNLVFCYLWKNKLSEDEWYDIVIFAYLASVRKWLARPDIHKWSFSTIAFSTMRAYVSHERKRQKQQIQVMSLDEILPGTDKLTGMERITYDDLNRIYEEGKIMRIEYDVQLPEPRVYRCEETLAIKNFLAGSAQNMKFEYESADQAQKKSTTIRDFQRRTNSKEFFSFYRRKNCIYIVRLDKARKIKKGDEK